MVHNVSSVLDNAEKSALDFGAMGLGFKVLAAKA